MTRDERSLWPGLNNVKVRVIRDVKCKCRNEEEGRSWELKRSFIN